MNFAQALERQCIGETPCFQYIANVCITVRQQFRRTFRLDSRPGPGGENLARQPVPGSKYQSSDIHGSTILQVSGESQTIDFSDFFYNAADMKEKFIDHQGWLIADIGATSSRCAILQAPDYALGEFRIFANDDFSSPAALLSAFVSTDNHSPKSCVLAIAAPIHGDDVEMINRDWQFSRPSLAKLLELDNIQFLNDFHAIAYALPVFDEQSRIEIGKAREYRDASIAVIGPGSGLGMSAWIGNKSNGSAMFGEGGHITVAARNDREDEIVAALRKKFGHCSAERLLSGPGLIGLHEAMHGTNVETSEEITANFGDKQCAETLNQFFSFLGSAAADLALITGAFGGVYIAGGIVPACIDQLMASPFRERFEDKNRYREYMQCIPTYVITDPVPGLRGLAAYIADYDFRG